MSKMKCIIVEDEPLAVKVLTDYIAQVPFLELHGSFKDAILATDYLRSNIVDLIFLDIHLPKLKGMAFLRTLTNPPAIVITTAYHQYAVEGFNLNVTDYLLKPFEFERFLVAVTKVKTAQTEKPRTVDEPEARDYLFLNVQKKKVKILFSEITFWQGLGILVLAKILFGSFGGRGGSGHYYKKQRMMWNSMTPEQKERFKEEWKNRSRRWGYRSSESNTYPVGDE